MERARAPPRYPGSRLPSSRSADEADLKIAVPLVVLIGGRVRRHVLRAVHAPRPTTGPGRRPASERTAAAVLQQHAGSGMPAAEHSRISSSPGSTRSRRTRPGRRTTPRSGSRTATTSPCSMQLKGVSCSSCSGGRIAPIPPAGDPPDPRDDGRVRAAGRPLLAVPGGHGRAGCQPRRAPVDVAGLLVPGHPEPPVQNSRRVR